MALAGASFAAHHRHDKLTRPVAEASKAILKERCVSDPSVQHVSVIVVELVSVGAAAKRVPEKDVLNSLASQDALELRLIELGAVPRPGLRSDVGDHFHTVKL